LKTLRNIFILGNSLGLLCVLAGCAGKTQNHAFTRPGHAVATNHAEMVTITNELDRQWLESPSRMFTLGPGDRLELELIGDLSSRTTTVVGPDGKLYFNLLPGVDVWGLTLTEAKTRLENTFTNYLREQPRIAMTLRGVESKRVWILGACKRREFIRWPRR